MKATKRDGFESGSRLSFRQRFAPVEQPRKPDGAQRQQGGDACHQQVERREGDGAERVFQPVAELMKAFERQVDEAAQHRKHGQRNERQGHHARGFFGVRRRFVAGSAPKNTIHTCRPMRNAVRKAAAVSSQHPRMCRKASGRISSFDQNPASGKIPAGHAPIWIHPKGHRHRSRRPPVLRISPGSTTAV